MKNIYLLILIVPGFLLFPGCHKSNSGGINSASGSQWTINNTTYHGLVTTYNDTSSALGILVSADAAGNYISVVFYSHPSTGGTYTVINGSSPGGTSCLITVATNSGGSSALYSSTGKTGDKVTLTIVGGKLTASFTGITVVSGTTTTTVTGTVIQQ